MADRTQPTLLLLGATGKLGRALQACWRVAPPGDMTVTGLARRRNSSDIPVWVPGGPLPATGPVRAVIAAWGVTSGTREDMDSNIALARAALDLAREVGAERVLHFSSAAVYGRGDGPLGEEDAPDPQAPYGASKLRMENAVDDWHKTFEGGPRSVILRIGNVAGADMLFGNMRAGQSVTLHRLPDGTAPRRSYIAPADLARVIAALVQAPDPARIYNVAAPAVTGMDAIATEAGVPIRWQEAPETALPEVWLNTDRLRAVLSLGQQSAQPRHLIDGARQAGLWP